MKTTSTTTAFLRGFCSVTGLSTADAAEQWAGYSRQLNDDQIARIEAGGFDAGADVGAEFMQVYS